MNFVGAFIYDLSLTLYKAAVIIASPFNVKASQWLTGRENWEKLKGFQWRKGRRLWFHCASLGEFEQARPVMEKWRNEHPDDSILLTFFSPSGYEIRKNYDCADLVLYLPLDTASNARLFIELSQPDVVLFVKYEFWFHYLGELKRRNVPTILFSSVFRKQQVFFKWYGGFFRNMLTAFTKIYVQNEGSKNLLQSISIPSEINSDTRFDRVYQIAQNPKKFPAIEKFKEGHKLFIAGSTWRRDEEMILQLIRDNVIKGYKYIIAPHDVGASNIASLLDGIAISKKTLSELTAENAAETQVIIVDGIGQLSSLYAFADVAYIGGAFSKGVHNVLEAAVYGLPVIFGPHYLKSLEAIELYQRGAAFSFASYPQFASILHHVTKGSEGNIKHAVIQSKKYVFESLGGTDKINAEIKRILNTPTGS